MQRASCTGAEADSGENCETDARRGLADHNLSLLSTTDITQSLDFSRTTVNLPEHTAILFVGEAKNTRATDSTFDSQMKRALATVALNFVRNKDDSTVVVPDGTSKRLAEKYAGVLAEVNSQIMSLSEVPSLREVRN